MAIVRCQDHPPRNTNYAIAVEPVGYPETSLICGRRGSEHEEVGWVYLLPEEYDEYQSGKRVFGLWGPDSSSSAAKVQVSDEAVEGLNKWNQEEEESASGLQSQSSIDRY
ncbi:hypothetical protein JCM30237_06170 [Halolamina litorea]